nr:head-tail adaptor protein [uncultured Celeribacter sp.]
MRADVHLNRRLILQAANRSADGAGGYSESWTQLGVLWAEITPGRGRALGVQGGAAIAQIQRDIVVRAAPEGSPRRPIAGQRFVEGGRVFPILSVSDHDPRGRYLRCRVREEVAL